MKLLRSDFAKDIRLVMNETGWDDSYTGAFIGSDTTDIEKMAEKVFPDAWRRAGEVLPASYFPASDFSRSCATVHDCATGTGYVVLPADFYKLLAFQLKGWDKEVHTALPESDDLLSLQANDYTRGNRFRPVCCLRNEPGKETVLRYWSLPRGMEATISVGKYIQLVKEFTDGLEVTDRLYRPLLYITGSLLYRLMEKEELAKILEQQAVEMAG